MTWLVALITLFSVGFQQRVGIFVGDSQMGCIACGFWFVSRPLTKG